MSLRLLLNKAKIHHKVKSDKFGLFVAQKWKLYINPYTPRDTGQLMKNVEYQPFQIHYKEHYAEYVYDNTRGVRFITRGNGRNPYATDHWDIKAEQAGQKDKLYRSINSALRSGKI